MVWVDIDLDHSGYSFGHSLITILRWLSYENRRAHVVLAHFLEEQRAVPAAAGADPAHDPDRHRQNQELDRVQAGVVARDRHQVT